MPLMQHFTKSATSGFMTAFNWKVCESYKMIHLAAFSCKVSDKTNKFSLVTF